MISIIPIMLPLTGLDALAREAACEGIGFLDRLVREWSTGDNRFDKSGEVLRGVYAGPTLVAIGGLNIDPFADDAACGRLRHVYVKPDHRAQGVGRQLVGALLTDARRSFKTIRLRAGSAPAAAFYLALGFSPLTDEQATHVLSLRRPA